MKCLVVLFLCLFQLILTSWRCNSCPMVCSCYMFVSCSSRDLHEIPSGIPQYTPRLFLSHNSITIIPAYAFVGLDNLEMLHLNYNNIKVIHADAFNGLHQLVVLRLSNNDIIGDQMTPNAFRGLDNLSQLYLDNNNMTTIPDDIFSGLRQLKILTFDRNCIDYISPNGFRGLDNLEELFLAYNHITTVPADVFKGLTTMKYINLDFNDIHYISPNAFNSLDNLDNLSLNSSMMLSFLPSSIFDTLVKLSDLNLSNNKLTSLPQTVFHELIDLTSLQLAGNELTSLNPVLFQGLPELSYLGLAGNPFSCDCEIHEFKEWIQTIDMNVEVICEYPVGYKGSDLTDLTMSDLICTLPVFNKSFEHVYVDENESVTLDCDVTGLPMPYTHWVTPDGLTIHYDDSDESQFLLNPDDSLVILSANSDMEGQYECIANNTAGIATAVRLLTVNGTREATSPLSTGIKVAVGFVTAVIVGISLTIITIIVIRRYHANCIMCPRNYYDLTGNI